MKGGKMTGKKCEKEFKSAFLRNGKMRRSSSGFGSMILFGLKAEVAL